MWKPISVVSLLALLPLSVHVQAGGAVCHVGQGCTCLSMEAGLLPILLDSDVVGDMTSAESIVIDRSSNTTFRTRRNLQEIHQAFGGRGECPTSAPPDEMTPLDGTWQWRTLGETANGCPPVMMNMLAASRTETLDAEIVWGGRFDPQRLAASLPQPEMAEMSPYEWREIARNRWLADNIRNRECSDGTCVEVALALNMNLVAADRITGLLSLRNRVEGGASEVLSDFGMLDCRVRVRYEINRIGP